MMTYLITTTHDDYVIEADDAELAEIVAEFDYVDGEYTIDVVDVTDIAA